MDKNIESHIVALLRTGSLRYNENAGYYYFFVPTSVRRSGQIKIKPKIVQAIKIKYCITN